MFAVTQVEFKKDADTEWNMSPMEKTLPSRKYTYEIPALRPATAYLFRINVTYNTSEFNHFVWPVLIENAFQFNTSGKF